MYGKEVILHFFRFVANFQYEIGFNLSLSMVIVFLRRKTSEIFEFLMLIWLTDIYAQKPRI